MPKLQTLTRTARGLYTNWNAVNGIPEGGLLEALNVNIDQMGVLSKMRGRKRFGDPIGTTTAQILEFWDYIGFIANGVWMAQDTTGTLPWLEVTGPDPTTSGAPGYGYFYPVLEINKTLYIIGSSEYVRLVHPTTMKRAGMRPGIDLELTKTGTGGGMFAVDSQVAYRYVFVRKNPSYIGGEVVGPPSRREIAANIKTTSLAFTNSGGTITVTHTAHGYATNDIIEILDSSDTAQVANGPKTITSTGANTYTFAATGAGVGGTLSDGKKFNHSVYVGIPIDVYTTDQNTYIRLYRTAFSASATTDPGDEMMLIGEYSVSNVSYMTISDDREEAFLSDYLYTNATQQGIAMSNEEPPIACDIAYWKRHVWLGHTISRYYLDIALDSILGLTDGTSSVSLRDTDSAWEYTFVFDTAENFTTGRFKRFTTEPTQAQNVEKTAKSLCKVINRYSTARDYIRARYMSEANDRPGKIRIEGASLATADFQIKANDATCGGKWTPVLPTSYGYTVISVSDNFENELANSKCGEHEAFPFACRNRLGSIGNDLLRILALRDSLICITTRGVYRVSGESDGLGGFEFVISELDPSIQGLCPRTWVILNNAVYGLSTQGVVRIDESGTDLISGQIEEELKLIQGYTQFKKYTHAVAYESDRKYILYYRDNVAENTANKAFVYNYLTNTWTKREKKVTSAICCAYNDKLYEAQYFDPATNHYILQERKGFSADLTDFQDEDATGTLTSHGTTTFEGATVSTVVTSLDATFEAIGSYFVQGALTAHVVAYAGGVCTLDKLLAGLVDGNACTLYKGISSRVRWRPEACQNPAVLKQFPRVSLYFEAINALRHKVAFFSDENRTEEALADLVQSATLDNPMLGVNVPRKFQRARALDLVYEHNRAREGFDILNVAYTFRPYGDLTTRSPR